jgi:hypothetical protein
MKVHLCARLCPSIFGFTCSARLIELVVLTISLQLTLHPFMPDRLPTIRRDFLGCAFKAALWSLHKNPPPYTKPLPPSKFPFNVSHFPQPELTTVIMQNPNAYLLPVLEQACHCCAYWDVRYI